ncbi:isoleucine--tRNA ligase [Novosphingobium umbonatum]|uniref:Isoleucine--tRNA ligase n=1 Tax=Novosphingobium umbonatum TaxID=1908524 RepID=A0A437N2X0_9SPHN|nr:isoleucine--tRNA ligase [Novosphingobium umbonatum]RVU04271.1 isoleucine--tRNA ligase [Novosphingobium umbonatum]
MTEKRDFRSTVFLPKTDFPMKAGLPQKEPAILKGWQEQDLYRRLRDARAGRKKFILHDGPPYANGNIHVGHAVNHILKDMVVRTQSLLGKDAPYVPGWDCHGLPIEWKVEEEYRKKKKNKDEVPPKEFRAECRAYARQWVDAQREQLKRLGVNGDWDNPYLTMDFAAEGTIVAELLKFAESGQLYRGAKPVMWSPVEKTALAEAEVEYEDITSTQIDVAFEIIESPEIPELIGTKLVIWTTTPWTIPTNQAVAFGRPIDYLQIKAGEEKYLIAEPLIDSFLKRIDEDGYDFLMYVKGPALTGAKVRHPMHHLGGFFATPRPLLAGDFVTTDSGTGFVHMAPDHGEDDFALCKSYGIKPVFAVENDGRYRADWLWLGGEGSVINPKFNAPDGPICTALREAGGLVAASADYKHSYPHSWRSKAKVIYRCTPQWFVPMDKDLKPMGDDDDLFDLGSLLSPDTLRERAKAAIAATRFIPEKGRNRIGAMVEGRPDWVLSRQRAWGVPITLFVHRETGVYLNDAAVNARIIAAIKAEGVDAWDEERAQDYLGENYRLEDYERVTDILDVWFDSGSTHAFVLESGRWPDLLRPEGYTGPHADLYLEGSDQHRGWFQSSLLEACGTRGHAPYKAVLTHGFTMDAKGMKMSKSLGNTVDPIKVMETYGADIVRLWALSVDYTEDHRIGDEILKGVADQYRKLRNTFRYLLGALDGFSDAEKVAVEAMPELERYVLALLAKLDGTLKAAVDAFDFNTYVRALTDFCNEDLSAFFFDIRKDCLYCDAPTDPKRMAYRTVLDTLLHALIRYAAPVLVFTAEEVWKSRFPEADSVHLLEWPVVDAGWADESLTSEWTYLREIRSTISQVVEPKRREKEIGSSLQACIQIRAESLSDFNRLSGADLAEIAIVASVDVSLDAGHAAPKEHPAIFTSVAATEAHKCGRCWRHLPEVTEDGDLCSRCDQVVSGMDAA